MFGPRLQAQRDNLVILEALLRQVNPISKDFELDVTTLILALFEVFWSSDCNILFLAHSRSLVLFT